LRYWCVAKEFASSFRNGSRAAVAGRLVVLPVYPQLRK
jgi:hypothetical protein